MNILFTNVLTESRISDLINAYIKKYPIQKEELERLIHLNKITVDPEYKITSKIWPVILEWLVHRYDNSLPSYFRGEPSNLILWINLYFLKYPVYFQKRGITSVEDIAKNFDKFAEICLEFIEVLKQKHDRIANEQANAKKLYDDEKWLLIHALNLEASVKYAKNTRWCINSINPDGSPSKWFKHYVGDGAMLILINKQKADEKYAIVINDNRVRYWAAGDQELEDYDFFQYVLPQQMYPTDHPLIHILQQYGVNRPIE